MILLLLLGGLALNLTPVCCRWFQSTSPSSEREPSGSRTRGFLLGAAYGGAMALVYGVLGVIVILTAGTFGTINSSPWFNLGIAVIFVVLSFAMFDVLQIDLSRSGSLAASPSKRGSVALAFVMGAVAALAGACVAPVVIQVVLLSDMYAGDRRSACVAFLARRRHGDTSAPAGAGLTSLPKPGAWMVRVAFRYSDPRHRCLLRLSAYDRRSLG